MSTIDEKQECPILQEVLNHIKLESKSGISSCLARLKNDPKCYKQFVKDGGLGILVNLLRYHNLKILNMTLSILANACMTADAREKVQAHFFYFYLFFFVTSQRTSSTASVGWGRNNVSINLIYL